MNGDRAPISLRDAFLGYLGAWVLGNILAAIVFSGSGADSVAEAGPVWLAAASLAQWVPLIAVVVVLGKRAGTGNLFTDFGFAFRPIDALGIPIGVATQFAITPLYVPLQKLWPDTFETEELERRARELWEGASGAGTVLLVVIVAIGAPLVEELTYRGLLQGAATRRFTQARGWLAVVAVAALFALVHFTPVEYPGLFLAGLIFGACALRTGRLGMSILAHVAFNATALAWVANS